MTAWSPKKGWSAELIIDDLFNPRQNIQASIWKRTLTIDSIGMDLLGKSNCLPSIKKRWRVKASIPWRTRVFGLKEFFKRASSVTEVQSRLLLNCSRCRADDAEDAEWHNEQRWLSLLLPKSCPFCGKQAFGNSISTSISNDMIHMILCFSLNQFAYRCVWH